MKPKEQIMEEAISKFKPLTEEQQEHLLALLIQSQIEMLEKLENNRYENKAVVIANIQNYQMLADIFINDTTFNRREFMLKQAQAIYDNYFGKASKA